MSPQFGVDPPTPEPEIFDGTPTMNCQWPTAAMLGFSGCTATLVSPHVVITAAHCIGQDVDNPGDVEFGENVLQPERAAAVEYCHIGPEWDFSVNNGVGGSDIAYCKLYEPIYDYPVTPIVYGCETEILFPGNTVWIVGIGANASDETGFGTKRMGETVIAFVDDDITENGIGIGNTDHDSCQGDSGGPAYVQYPDGSWHAFGVVSGGPSGCGSFPSQYTAMHAWVPWIEEDSGIDITPCHDTDGTWNPTGWCQGFEMDPFDDGDWKAFCLGEVSGASETCGTAFNADPDAEAPTVSVTMPADETTFDTAPADVTVAIETDDGDGWGVRFVRVKINGDEQPLVLREPPFQFNADFPQGVFEIVGVSEDWAGNIGESEPIRIAIDAELPPEPEETTSGGSLDDSGSGDGSTSAPIDGTTTGDGPVTDTDDPGETESGSGCGCRTEQRMGPAAPAALLGGLMVMATIRRRLRSAGPRP